jgi:hypothetical protein
MLRRIFRRKAAPSKVRKPKRETPWPINVNVRLLALQGLGFLFLAFFTAPPPPIPAHRLDELWLPALFVIFSLLSILAALGLLRLRLLAWDVAMLVEGAALLLALALYMGVRPFYVYPIMLVCTIVVINLNQPELRRAFPTEIIEPGVEEKRAN